METDVGPSDGTDLTPELRQVVRRMNTLPSWGADLMGTMEVLLAADNTAARGKAFGRYCSDWRGTRHGGPQQPFTARIQQAVRRCAAQELASAAGRPGPARDTRPNHDDALYALWFCARPKDGPLVADVLLNAMKSEPHLLYNGIVVAGGLLESGARRSIINRLVEALRRIAGNPEVDPYTRGTALRELGNGSRRKETTLLLAAALDHPDLEIASVAALTLLERAHTARFTNRIRRLAATWPTDSPTGSPLPWAVDWVRRHLRDGRG